MSSDELFADYPIFTPGHITYRTLLAIIDWRNRHGISDNISKDTVLAYQEEGQSAAIAGLELGLIDYGQATGCEEY